MAEIEKQASSPFNSKEKDSLLDVDFGKDFLSSWKTMSVAEGDAMDFEFGPVAKGKRKAFNFDKLDVDFTLDGDLDKLSFKVDMSDLDISSPPKRAGKSKERSKESDGGNQMKQDRFSFPFDFNELDSFSLESSVMKHVKQSNKNQSSEEVSSRSKCQGSETDLTDATSASKIGLTPKLPASVGAINSKIESPVGGSGDLDPIKKNFPSNPERDDNSPLKSATVPIEAASVETRIFQEKTSATVTQDKNQESHQQEKITSPEPFAEETMQDLSVQHVSVKESTQHISPEIEVELCSQATKVHRNAEGDQSEIFNSVGDFGFNGENPAMENSPAQDIARSLINDGERNKSGSDSNVAVACVDGAEPAQGDSSSEYTPTIRVSLEAMQDTSANGDAQNANGKLQLSTLSSGTSVGKLIQMKENQAGTSQSKYFKKSDESESPSQPSTQAKPTIFGGKIIDYQKQGSADHGREGIDTRDAQSRNKLVGISRPHPGEINNGDAVQPGSRITVKGLTGIGERYCASGALKGTKLYVSSRTCVRGVEKVQSPGQGSERSKENLTTRSSCFSASDSSGQINKSTTQSYVNPRLPASSIASVKNLNDVCDEGRKLSSPKAGRSVLDLSSLKISRSTIGAKLQPSKSTLEKEIKPLRNTVQNLEQRGSTASKMALSARAENQTPPTPPLKRKAFQGLNADMLTLNPSKRLSPSATETRNGERSGVIDKEVCNNKKPIDDRPYNDVNDLQTSTPDTAREMNMAELEILLVLENDVNIEKADAYTKELEDICNMLKKKLEEAKEIFVRAIVNNNKLLMLNHPIYEEKIRKVQKFAAELMSK